jgi:hypothetical protein
MDRRAVTLVEVSVALTLALGTAAWLAPVALRTQATANLAAEFAGSARALQAIVTSALPAACGGSASRSLAWRTARGTLRSLRAGHTAVVTATLVPPRGGDSIVVRRSRWCD